MKKSIFVLIFVFFASIVFAAPPTPHSIAGWIYRDNGVIQVPLGTDFIVLNHNDSNYVQDVTNIPVPGWSGRYSVVIQAEDGDVGYTMSWNTTHWGVTSFTFNGDLDNINVNLNMTKVEQNVTFDDPKENTSETIGTDFDVRVNITAIGGGNIGNCVATLAIINTTVLTLATGETYVHNIDLITKLDLRQENWTLTPSALGTSNLSVNVTCENQTNFTMDNSDYLFNITVVAGAGGTAIAYWSNPNSSTVLDLGTGVLNMTILSSERNITSNESNANVAVTCSGNCSQIFSNWTTVSMVDTQVERLQFNCSTNLTGYFSANFSLESDDDTTPDVLTVTCNITAPDVTFTRFVSQPSDPIENQTVVLNATIKNIGNANASNVSVVFWVGNFLQGIVISNQSVNLTPGENASLNVTYTITTGNNSFYVTADFNISTGGNIDESNEKNNYALLSLDIASWHIFTGNLSGRMVLSSGGSNEIFRWNISNSTNSNIFIVDTDSSINWASLKAIGRDTSNNYIEDDFHEVDVALKIENNSDSINKTYLYSGNPRYQKNFTIFSESVKNIAYVNSTNTSNFITGILWDSSDDGGDGSFDTSDKEDLVFITQANYQTQGKYDIYDFEIKVPSKLRSYLGTSNTVDFYVELR